MKLIKKIWNNIKKYIKLILVILIFLVSNSCFFFMKNHDKLYVISYINLTISIFYLIFLAINLRFSNIKNKKGVINLICLIFEILIPLYFITFYIIFYANNKDYLNNFFELTYLILNEILFILIIFEAEDSTITLKKKSEDVGLDLLSSKISQGNDFVVDKIYNAVLNENCYSIAIDGKYASGKSTLLNEFLYKYEHEFNCVRCSLATFESDEQKFVEKQNKTAHSDNLKVDEKNNIIGKVLDCILIKRRTQPNYLLGSIISVILYGVFCIMVTTNIFSLDYLNILFVSFIFSASFFLITFISTSITKGKISLSNYSFEFEIENDENKKKINEIINMFRKYNRTIVVIFEDLDRFNTINIYNELKELNFILNNILSNKIVFIYALDTSLFNKIEERTKFFDLIVPVIPKISSETGLDFLKNSLPEIDDKLLMIILKVTTNIRELMNLCNEYKIIRQYFFKENKSYYESKNDKILYIVALKNFFPCYYDDLFSSITFLDKIYQNCINNVYEKNKNDNLVDPINDFISSSYSSLNPNLNRILETDKISVNQLKNNIRIIIENGAYKIKLESKFNNLICDFICEGLILGFIEIDYKEYLTPIKFENIDLSDFAKRHDMYLGIVDVNYEFSNPYNVLKTIRHNMYMQQSIMNYSLISELYKMKNIFPNYLSLFRRTFIVNYQFDTSSSFSPYKFKPALDNKNFVELIRAFALNFEKKQLPYDKEFLLDIAYSNQLKMFLKDDDIKILGLIMNLALNEETDKNNYIREVINTDFINSHNNGKFIIFFNEFSLENLLAIKKYTNKNFVFGKNTDDFNDLIFENYIYDLGIDSLRNKFNSSIDLNIIINNLMLENNRTRYEEINKIISSTLKSNITFLISKDFLIKFCNELEQNYSIQLGSNFFNNITLKDNINNCDELPTSIRKSLDIFIKKGSILLCDENVNYFTNNENFRLEFCTYYIKEIISIDKYIKLLNKDICEKIFNSNTDMDVEYIKKIIDKDLIDLKYCSNNSKRLKLLRYADKYDNNFDKISLSIFCDSYRTGENKMFCNLNKEDAYYEKLKDCSFSNTTFVNEVMPNYFLNNYRIKCKDYNAN